MDTRFKDYDQLSAIAEYFEINEGRAFHVFFRDLKGKMNNFKRLIKVFIENDNLYMMFMTHTDQILTIEACNGADKKAKQRYYKNQSVGLDISDGFMFEGSWHTEYNLYKLHQRIDELTRIIVSQQNVINQLLNS